MGYLHTSSVVTRNTQKKPGEAIVFDQQLSLPLFATFQHQEEIKDRQLRKPNRGTHFFNNLKCHVTIKGGFSKKDGSSRRMMMVGHITRNAVGKPK